MSTGGSSAREGGARASILPVGRFENTEDISAFESSIAPDEPLSNSLFDSLAPEQRA